jgi:hypothetical protein
MNEKFHTHLKKAGEEMSLTQEQRQRMRGVLHAYMEMKPIRARTHVTSVSTFSWFFSARPIAAVLVLALFASSVGISYAAENALPGDVLYPIKTDVNEPVQGALATTASAKAAWAMSVAGERVQEAATLAAEDKLSTSTQQALQSNFETHADIAAQAIAQQASSSPTASAETAISFQAQLAEYQNVLAQVGSTTMSNTMPLADAIRNEGRRLDAIRAASESRIASTSEAAYATANMQVAAQEQLNTSAQLAQSDSGSLSTSSAQLVSAQLDTASTTISAGEALAAQDATSSALGAFQSALTSTEELGVFLQTSSSIHSHTGLVVGQPQQDPSGGAQGGRQYGGPDHGVHAAWMMNATSTATSTSSNAPQSSATTSTDESVTNVSAQAEVQAPTPSDGSQSVPASSSALPLSLPTPLSL